MQQDLGFKAITFLQIALSYILLRNVLKDVQIICSSPCNQLEKIVLFNTFVEDNLNDWFFFNVWDLTLFSIVILEGFCINFSMQQQYKGVRNCNGKPYQ